MGAPQPEPEEGIEDALAGAGACCAGAGGRGAGGLGGSALGPGARAARRRGALAGGGSTSRHGPQGSRRPADDGLSAGRGVA
ncbi:hypothetical protein C884_02437 [Kocuria palustris PEL]|uniref:Uncharacterized protein n=1 Tax=Kocuria palustris PEL TaxID=1236550 RepID=M2YE54_9MICC|nr:hypothetical protein C884_02437 [Kocuria palustris PEL]